RNNFDLHSFPTRRSSDLHMLMHLPGVAKKFVLLITNSAYQVENSMGKIVEVVKTGTKFLEQVLNKTLLSTSIIVKILTHCEKLTENFKRFVVDSFFPTLLKCRREQDTASTTRNNSNLNETEFGSQEL